jgi:hypothetical protein
MPANELRIHRPAQVLLPDSHTLKCNGFRRGRSWTAFFRIEANGTTVAATPTCCISGWVQPC